MEGQLIAAIRQAKQSIEISIYSLTHTKVIQALTQRAQEGLDVAVVLDHRASPYAAKKLGTPVKSTGIEGRGLMHHKIFLIDNQDIWLGSANLTRESLRTHSNMMQRIHCPPLADFIHKKLHTMQAEGLKKPFLHQVFPLGQQSLEMWFLPDDPEAATRVQELIKSAKKTIQVAMYTFTRLDFAKTLIEAAERDVKVEVIMDRSMCEGVCQKVVKAFERTPVQLYTSEGSALLHNKMMIIDGKILEHGSANWTRAAFTQNDDYFIVLYDLTLKEQKELKALWQALLQRSAPLP